MNEITTGPELEACGWYVRTKRTDVDAAGWLVADCSTVPHGKEYARLFAASPVLLAAASAFMAAWDEGLEFVSDECVATLRNAIALATTAPEEAPEPVRHFTINGGV
ncbi:hypothetical protein L0Z11_11440 [Burkholderia multivorans]|uniref:hypothetical protein n=1 Tax=Burkholderia multivorans TaxID=87883 RepID=UPI0020193BBA|nr:hypothetical protein [Burkholderia multivorans]UQN68299.1 hypothetical protein L0Z45_11460 [Burkholderia multivorans]UQN74028.1 hypothetical protein L0Z11_11440 [Burkholderia multivorans]